MKLLHTFNAEKYSEKEIKKMKLHKAVRIILFDDKKDVAILYMARDNYYSLPGGGIEKTETFQEGFMRECWEETGCRAEVIKKLGQINEVRGKHNLVKNSICFIAKVIGKKGPLNLESDELEEEIKLMWVGIDKAIALISDFSDEVSLYNRYTLERDLLFLKEAKKLNL